MFILGGIGFPKDDKSPATTAAAEAFEWWRLLASGHGDGSEEAQQDIIYRAATRSGIGWRKCCVIETCHDYITLYFFVVVVVLVDRYSSYSSSDLLF